VAEEVVPAPIDDNAVTSTVSPAEARRARARALVFSLAAVCFGLAAAWLFPDRAIVREPDSLYLGIYPTVQLRYAFVTIGHLTPTSGRVQFSLGSNAPGEVTVDTQLGDHPPLCTAQACNFFRSERVELTMATGRFRLAQYDASLTVPYSGAIVGWSENGLDLEALTPEISVLNVGGAAGKPPATGVTCEVGDFDRYDWGTNVSYSVPQPGLDETPAVVLPDSVTPGPRGPHGPRT
jgi:hypothetical protein